TEVQVRGSGLGISRIPHQPQCIPRRNFHPRSGDDAVEVGVVEGESAFAVAQPDLFSAKAPVPRAGDPSAGGSHHGSAPGCEDIDAFVAPPSSIAPGAPVALNRTVTFGDYWKFVYWLSSDAEVECSMGFYFGLYHHLVNSGGRDLLL